MLKIKILKVGTSSTDTGRGDWTKSLITVKNNAITKLKNFTIAKLIGMSLYSSVSSAETVSRVIPNTGRDKARVLAMIFNGIKSSILKKMPFINACNLPIGSGHFNDYGDSDIVLRGNEYGSQFVMDIPKEDAKDYLIHSHRVNANTINNQASLTSILSSDVYLEPLIRKFSREVRLYLRYIKYVNGVGHRNDFPFNISLTIEDQHCVVQENNVRVTFKLTLSIYSVVIKKLVNGDSSRVELNSVRGSTNNDIYRLFIHLEEVAKFFRSLMRKGIINGFMYSQ